LLKQLLLSLHEQVSEKDGQIEHLREQNALLIQRLFGRKSEQTADPDSPQMDIFNEAEDLAEAAPETPVAEAEEEVVAPVKRRGKRKPLPAELPRVEVIHELPEHELTCACGCRKQMIGEETSEQLEIIPMQVRVIKHIRKTYACKGCEAAPVTADKPAHRQGGDDTQADQGQDRIVHRGRGGRRPDRLRRDRRAQVPRKRPGMPCRRDRRRG
jgi:hypothetical protein